MLNIYNFLFAHFFFSLRQYIPCAEIGMVIPAVIETKPKEIIPQFTTISKQRGEGGGAKGINSIDNRVSNGDVGLPSQPYRGNCG